ncbi:MAG TPA: YiiX/YebB-like N1pC/P60 family cysteine hydrolase [Hyphomonas sp.]|nr:YiiX/YebB-like N1pC/P60 family cysteine hydrolase [Hyphomonas sp.]HRK67053.1 YiiX/YebB-like N1pC/P60 family cysteine hydrolase [Hyphomonas sp.]
MLRKVIPAAVLALLAAPAALAQLEPGALPALESGDLLFKGAETGAGTRIAAGWSLGDKRWGHVGIVADGGQSVIHADTGEPGEVGAVRKVALVDFLADVETLGVYEIRLTGEAREKYVAFAESAVGLPFDHGFSIRTENSLYCSELVWRAMSAGLGEDAVPEKSARLGRTYVSVSDLSDHPLLRESATVTEGRVASLAK